MARTRALSGIVPGSEPAKPTPAAPSAKADPVALPARPPKPVRLTLDLPPDRHAELVRWCLDAAPGVGTPRVPGQQVLRALLTRLLTDDELSRQIIADLRDLVT